MVPDCVLPALAVPVQLAVSNASHNWEFVRSSVCCTEDFLL